MHEKLQTRRGLALTTRNDIFCANCNTLNDDRSEQHHLVYSRQEGNSQVHHLGQNHPLGLFQDFHFEKYIRGKERCGGWQRKKRRKQKAGRQKRKLGHILDRIGEASNPGPSHKSHSKQSRLGDYFLQHHTKKDDKDM
eukprot:10003204-Heterocapsa_arctica.AAC.1